MSTMITRKISEITVCDYCHDHRCSWTEHSARDPLSLCPGGISLKLSDSYLHKIEFARRLELIKRMARFDPSDKQWYLDPTRKDPLTGHELKRAVEQDVNDWCADNDLTLMGVISYLDDEKTG